MTTSAKLASVVLLSSLSLVPGAASAWAEEVSVHRVAPLKGITLSVGSKRAVGYYQATQNACNLTLLLADAYTGSETASSEPVRINLIVREGTSARVDALEGSLAFQCAPGATAMTVQPMAHVAYNAVAK